MGDGQKTEKNTKTRTKCPVVAATSAKAPPHGDTPKPHKAQAHHHPPEVSRGNYKLLPRRSTTAPPGGLPGGRGLHPPARKQPPVGVEGTNLQCPLNGDREELTRGASAQWVNNSSRRRLPLGARAETEGGGGGVLFQEEEKQRFLPHFTFVTQELVSD